MSEAVTKDVRSWTAEEVMHLVTTDSSHEVGRTCCKTGGPPSPQLLSMVSNSLSGSPLYQCSLVSSTPTLTGTHV